MASLGSVLRLLPFQKGRQEILYDIEGVLTWTVDGMPIEVGPRTLHWLKESEVHRKPALKLSSIRGIWGNGFPETLCKHLSGLGSPA